MIPDSYQAWRHCIEVDCRQPLTAAFIAERLQELQDYGHFRTVQFVNFYGSAHHQRVLGWFAEAARTAA